MKIETVRYIPILGPENKYFGVVGRICSEPFMYEKTDGVISVKIKIEPSSGPKFKDDWGKIIVVPFDDIVPIATWKGNPNNPLKQRTIAVRNYEQFRDSLLKRLAVLEVNQNAIFCASELLIAVGWLYGLADMAFEIWEDDELREDLLKHRIYSRALNLHHQKLFKPYLN